MARRKSKRRTKKQQGQAQSSNGAVNGSNAGPARRKAPTVFVPGATPATSKRESDSSQWLDPDGELGRAIEAENVATLESYRVKPLLVDEHARQEANLAEGGYASRQIVELTQNSADAMVESGRGTITAELSRRCLYFADDGAPVEMRGVESFLQAYLSTKSGGEEIGRFGLGFKSLLRISNSISFFSLPGSFNFDRDWSDQQVRSVDGLRSVQDTPMMRLARPIDPLTEASNDPTLERLMRSSTNVVRANLTQGAYERLEDQLEEFPSEFLLLADRVRKVVLINSEKRARREINVERNGKYLELIEDAASSRWLRFEAIHALVQEALDNRRSVDEDDAVKVTWLVPTAPGRGPGGFWAYFPTEEECLISGILNAPWKLNEDRTSLLDDPYNRDLIEAAANLVADSLWELSTDEDPGRHLDALPRREDVGDRGPAIQLRRGIYEELHSSQVVPGRDGELRRPQQILYPPSDLVAYKRDSAAHKAISNFNESDFVPSHALDESAASERRWVRVEQLNDPRGRRRNNGGKGARHASVKEWLEALTRYSTGSDPVEASREAIRVARSLPEEVRDKAKQASIILTQSGEWRPVGDVNLPHPAGFGNEATSMLVHDRLASDEATRSAMVDLGVVEISPEAMIANWMSNSYPNPDAPDSQVGDRERDWNQFWLMTRSASAERVAATIDSKPGWRSWVRVLKWDGTWAPLGSVLFHGGLFQEGEGASFCVDPHFHKPDMQLISLLGVADRPGPRTDMADEPDFEEYADLLKAKYQDVPHRIGRRPHANKLNLVSSKGVGPMGVLRGMSPSEAAKYTEAVLNQPQAFEKWEVQHSDSKLYDPISYKGLTVAVLEEHGILDIGNGIYVRLEEARTDQSALRKLRSFPTWAQIKDAFELQNPMASAEDYEPIGEGDPIPLNDMWPGLLPHLSLDQMETALRYEVVPCQAISDRDEGREDIKYFNRGNAIYVVRGDRESQLMAVLDILNLNPTRGQVRAVLDYEDWTTEAERAEVRNQESDAERLLVAVGGEKLVDGLPENLKQYNRWKGRVLKGLDAAEAAISAYHTDALRHYRKEIQHLKPPSHWAGGPQISKFVEDLGFTAEWAGERRSKMPAFEEVIGPFTLDRLHDYQRRIVDEVRLMLKADRRSGTARRGLISLPTGAGKTRVAVQAIVEAMRDDEFDRNVLWVADREELLEQAIDAWQDVWRCIGKERQPLRVSRLFGGQDGPTDIDRAHVIVASIQTLNARLGHENPDYAFIDRIGLTVLDEAHHAVAPTYLRLMNNLGLGSRTDYDGPLLLGMTATPYRGRNEDETRQLVRRFSVNRLDRVGFGENVGDDPEEVIRYLQSPSMRVLARAKHVVIDGGDLDLTPEERSQTEGVPWLPRSAEDRLAENNERTEQILVAYEEKVARQAGRWPTLIFATSVDHAKTISAELCRRGIHSRSVDGETERGTRRKIVEDYRNGEIKVLVNYGVFREGFDAPQTRCIIVARPVFAPNAYFQMIGRGLRGPANGGNDECLIIDVEDNILNFKQKLAFTELDDFWD